MKTSMYDVIILIWLSQGGCYKKKINLKKIWCMVHKINVLLLSSLHAMQTKQNKTNKQINNQTNKNEQKNQTKTKKNEVIYIYIYQYKIIRRSKSQNNTTRKTKQNSNHKSVLHYLVLLWLPSKYQA